VSTDKFLEEFNRWRKGGRAWSKTRLSRTLNTMKVDGVEVIPVKVSGVSVRMVTGVDLVPADEIPDRLDIGSDGQGYRVDEPREDEVEPDRVGPDDGPAPDEVPI
jgi:hypothetical protein